MEPEPKIRWTTTRWVWPATVRQERYGQLHGSTKYKDVFDQKFLEGLEKRRDLLESRRYGVTALEMPLVLLLAFSLVNLDVKVSVAGFSIEGVRGLREILLVALGFLTMHRANIQRELDDVKEIMKAAVGKLSGGKADVREFLNVRYGLGELSSRGNPKLLLGWFHLTSAILVLLPTLLFAASFVVVALWIQLLNMREIWLHPNFSRAVSVVVIAFVLSTNFALFGMAWLKQGVQPFQTLEDFETLKKLEWKDKDRYTEILNELAKRYARKGYFSKLLFRTRMRRIK